MSKISDAFDAVKARLLVVFPDHKQLTNPYFLEENTEEVLSLGYGIAIGPGENSKRQISCNLTIRRDFTVILTRRRYSSDLLVTPKESAEKLLLEDQYSLIADLETDPTVNNDEVVIKFEYQSDGGIENIFTGEDRKDAYIQIASTFSLEYFENLN